MEDEAAIIATHHGAFGRDGFGHAAEAIARFLGTSTYLVCQTMVVLVWIVVNVLGVVHFDRYPFILLNLAFSTQAAYAAPLILLAATRQAKRDQHREDGYEADIVARLERIERLAGTRSLRGDDTGGRG